MECSDFRQWREAERNGTSPFRGVPVFRPSLDRIDGGLKMEDEQQFTRPEVDMMALCFLRDNGPDTIGILDTDEKFAAALVYLDLVKRGLVSSTNFGGGNVQHAITGAGLRELEGAGA